MFRIEIDDTAVTAALNRIASALTDMTPVMNDIGAALVRSSKDRIDKGLTPDGAGLAPLSPVTLARYAKLGKVSQGPLKLSGEMQSQIFHEYGPDFAEIGSNMIQAAVMQFGAAQGAFGAHIGKDKLGRDHFHSIPWGDIPARPFLGLSEDDSSTILEIVEEWLSGTAITG